MNKKVSVAIITYNHERFLRQAIDGVLNQQMDYEYEIVVGEDKSTDSTREILKEYAQKYPDLIVPLYREKNLGMFKNILDVLSHCQGEYIAILEGDDYWIAPDKLKRQIEFLDNNSEYSACSHGTYMVDMEGKIINDEYFRWKDTQGDYSIKNFENFELPFQTSSFVFRNNKRDMEKFYRIKLPHYFPGDRLFPLYLLSKGKIKIFEEMMSSYRLYFEENGTNWSSQYDVRYKHNYYLHFIFVTKIEKYAKEFGLELNMINPRLKLFTECMSDVKKSYSKRSFLQMVIMFLVEPHKRRFVRVYLEMKEVK